MILKRNLLYPCHIQLIQALLPRNLIPRINVLQVLIHTMAHNNNIFKFFSRCSYALWQLPFLRKRKIPRYWRKSFSATIDHLIGCFFLTVRLKGQSYTDFLRNHLPILLEEVLLLVTIKMYCMEDWLYLILVFLLISSSL